MFGPSALRQLESWGIPPDVAGRVGLFEVPDASQVYPGLQRRAAIVIPYYTPDRRNMVFGPHNAPFCRVRYIEPAKAQGFKHDDRKYDQPGNSGQKVYFPPLIGWAKFINDPSEGIVITEGEAKALCGAAAGFPVIALGGVFNFGGDALLPELELIQWRGRDVFIVFDSDAATNPQVMTAEARLVEQLHKRGARCVIVRLPPTDEGGKVGLDDFLKAHGPEALMQLLVSAPRLSPLDARCIAFNKRYAIINAEAAVYDLEEHKFLSRDFFVNGSDASAEEFTVPPASNQRSAPKKVSIATTWLKHPLAARFSEILFRPNEGLIVPGKHGRAALNMWQGWTPGDSNGPAVQAFRTLTRFVFKGLPDADRDFALKLMAYKAQRPDICSRMAIVMVGQQGTGKSLWAKCMRMAFSPYAQAVPSEGLVDNFREWMEQTLIAVFDEIEPRHLDTGGDILKNLITAQTARMNTKFRTAREISIYTTFILTANRHEVGAFAADDRRMFVVECPRKDEALPAEFYIGLDNELENGTGGKDILAYLLNYDLKGWTPPARAPDTHAKRMAYQESLTPIQQIAADMARSTDISMIAIRWVESAREWARGKLASNNSKESAQAQATLDATVRWPIRPWYEPRELALMFPHLIATTMGTRYDYSLTPGSISSKLRDEGVPALICKDSVEGFLWKGQRRQYLIVSNFDEWKEPLSQAEFERWMAHTREYGSLK